MNAQAAPVHHLIPEDFSQYSQLALLDQVRRLMAQERAVQYRLAACLRELDARDHIDGRPMRLTRWLHDVFGLTFGTAREKVRTARALGSLPLIDTAFRDGDLSYSKVRALTRIATPENEAALLEHARRTSAEGVEQIVRSLKQQESLEDVQALIRSRSLSTRWDETGALIIQGRLTPEQGEVFLKALAQATEAVYGDGDSDGESDDEDRYWNRRADALVQVMADSLAGKTASTPGDRHQVVVHVDAEALAAEVPDEDVPAGTSVSAETPESEGSAKNIPAGTRLHPETVRRLACDGGLLTIIESPRGDPLNVGRKTRAIPTSTRRALVARDRHCQFPGCSQERYVEGHHIKHWAQGGETRPDNLVLLCSRHHRAVHELGYRIERTPAGELRFIKPGG
ncbi:MAG: DUF222 domain-containing protein [Pseudomonadales bacterium]